MPVNRAELRWAVVCSLLVVILSSLPYLYACWNAGPELQFIGFISNPLDGNSYLAKMRQGELGAWLFHLPYTSEAHEGAFIFTFYLALGHLARLCGLPLVWTFHLARVVCGFVLLLTAYLFIARLTDDPAERRVAFWLVALSSGLGWLGVLFGLFPVDLWVPEAITFYSILANPHFPLAMALMLLIFMSVAWGEERPGFSSLLLSALVGLALAVVQPFALLIVGAVLAFYLALRLVVGRLTAGEVIASLVVGVAAAPVIVYDYYVSWANPALAAWSAQNQTPSPPVGDYLFGYGLLLLLAAPGAYRAYKRGSAGDFLLLSWVGATALLLYAPFSLQRRFITGFHLPLAILAAFGLWRVLLPRLAPALRGRALVGSIALTATGNVAVVLMLLVGVLRHDPRFYMTHDEMAAMAWLRDNARADDVILASPRTGMFIPAWGGGKVFYGHPFETIAAERKEALTEAFFAGQLQGADWDDLQRRYHITLVFYGPAERELGEQPPGVLRSLPVAFRAGPVSIYDVAGGVADGGRAVAQGR
jgi:hypothetical protein